MRARAARAHGHTYYYYTRLSLAAQDAAILGSFAPLSAWMRARALACMIFESPGMRCTLEYLHSYTEYVVGCDLCDSLRDIFALSLLCHAHEHLSRTPTCEVPFLRPGRRADALSELAVACVGPVSRTCRTCRTHHSTVSLCQTCCRLSDCCHRTHAQYRICT